MTQKSSKKIAPSILSANFARLEDEINQVVQAGADLIHVDVMDGHFVPNLTIGPVVIEAIRDICSLPLDVHLMIEQPERYLKDFADAGSHYLTVHVETCPHLHRTLQSIKELGVKAGVTLSPATPLNTLENIIEDVDLLLVMSVNPGFGGQSFIQNCLKKLIAARKLIDERNPRVELEVDGGIKIENIQKISATGVDIFVAGSAIFESQNYKETIDQMRKAVLSS